MEAVGAARNSTQVREGADLLARRRSIRIVLAVAGTFAVLGTDGRALADTDPVVLEEVVSGGAMDSTTVTTSGPVTAAPDALYLAAVASRKRFENARSVSGLGLQWTLVREQCGARSQSALSLWSAQGSPTVSEPVTAQLESNAESAVMTVVRYSGAGSFDPIGTIVTGALVSANTNGSQGACDGGVDSAAYNLDIQTISDGAQVFSAVAIRQRTHTPGPGYTEVAETGAGVLGAMVGLATQERTVPTAGVVPVDGSMNDTVDWAMIAVEITPAPDSVPVAPGDPPIYIWISDQELAALPMNGDAWDRVKAAADGDLGEPNVSAFNQDHNTNTLATAMVYVRTGDEFYREKAADAIMGVIGTEYTGCRKPDCENIGALAVTLGRNLACYAIAADLIDFNDYDPVRDATFRNWLDNIRYVRWQGGSLLTEDEQRTNTAGRVAGASRAALAVYLGDSADLQRAAQVFKGFTGDHDAYNGFQYTHRPDLSWQADELNPIGINPVGAMKDGHNIDGALPEEMRRGDSFQFPPVYTGYPWGALQGVSVEAEILHRQGYDAWSWEDRAILRAAEFLEDLALTYPDDPWWAVGDDRFVPWLINAAYGTDFPAEDARPGKIMGWTSWTHAPCEMIDGECIPLPEPDGSLMLLAALPVLAWLARRRGRFDA